jgi:hypothetical protein
LPQAEDSQERNKVLFHNAIDLLGKNQQMKKRRKEKT